MARRRADFSEDIRIRVLLWCDRHCCLCNKQCGVNIEVAHIDPAADGGSNDIDNAIPLCFECHSKIGHYNKRQPKGSKYSPKELKTRREQVYEEFTRHLVPVVHWEVTQVIRTSPEVVTLTFPEVGFIVRHLSDGLPVRVRTDLNIKLGDRQLGPPPDRGHYAGEKLWRLNPRFAHKGHFAIPAVAADSKEALEVEVSVTVIDVYEREHRLLTNGWVYNREGKYWYFEP